MTARLHAAWALITTPNVLILIALAAIVILACSREERINREDD